MNSLQTKAISRSTARRAALFMLIVFGQGSTLASAGTNEWTSLGPDGGHAFDVEFHPANPSILYLTAPSGFYRSMDGGHTWQVTKKDFRNFPADIAVSPANPERLVIAATDSGLLSIDGGATFTTSAAAFASTAAVRAEISRDGQTAYIGSGLNLYRSTDQGQTWALRTPLPGMQGGLINALEIDPSDANVVYASSYGLGIFASSDGGASWRSLTSAFPDLSQSHNFVLDPANPQRLLAAGEKGLFVSDNQGASWTATSITEQVTDIDVDPASSNTLYVSTGAAHVKKSTDGGASWTILPVKATGFSALRIAPSQSSRLALIGGSGVQLSEDGGTTWETRNSGLKAADIVRFTVGSDRIYAATGMDGIYAIPAGGSSITAVNNTALLQFSASPNFLAILNVAQPVQTLFAVPDYQTFVRSEDAGQSWTRVTSFPAPLAPQRLVASPPDSQTLYAASFERIYKSSDNGAQWSEASNGLPVTTDSEIVALAPTSNPAILYAAVRVGGGAGVYRIYKSLDAGASWTASAPDFSEYIAALAVHPTNDQLIYAGIGSNLRRSTDGGGTWTTLSSDGSPLCCTYHEIQFDKKNPKIVYAVSANAVMRSVDSGESWERLGSPSANQFTQLTALAIDPSAPSTLLLGTVGFGVQQITLSPDLVLNLTSPTGLALNTASTFTLTLKNSGPFDATNVRVVASLPTGTSNISASSSGATCTVVNTTATCSYDVLRSGAAVTTLTLNAMPTSTGSFVLSASISGDQMDSAATNNTVSQNLTVNASAAPAQSGDGGGGVISTELLLMLAALVTGTRITLGSKVGEPRP